MRDYQMILTIAMVLMVMVFSSCGAKGAAGVVTNDDANAEKMKTVTGQEFSVSDERAFLFPEIGCGIYLPESWNDENYPGLMPTVNETGYQFTYMPKDIIAIFENMTEDTMDEEKILQAYSNASNFMKVFFADNEEDLKKESKGYESCEKIADFNGKTYYFACNKTCPQKDNKLYTKAAVDEYNKLGETLAKAKDSIVLLPMETHESELMDFSSLQAKKVDDLNGENFTSEDFKDYDMTVINIWATWCGPCVGELPELEKTYKKLPENVNLITICTDGEEANDECMKILKDSGVTFTTLAGNKKLNDSILSAVTAYPTTVFVDSEGNLVGKEVLGANEADYYLKEIKSHMELLDEK